MLEALTRVRGVSDGVSPSLVGSWLWSALAGYGGAGGGAPREEVGGWLLQAARPQSVVTRHGQFPHAVSEGSGADGSQLIAEGGKKQSWIPAPNQFIIPPLHR